MWALGVNSPPASDHESSACLIDGDGRVVALGEEERFTRKKRGSFQHPRNAIRFCLEAAGISLVDVDVVAFGWDVPRLQLRGGMPWGIESGRALLETIVAHDVPERTCPDIQFVPHHTAHAASAFVASPFDHAAVIVADGAGEDESVSIFEARRGRPLVCRRKWSRKHSLGSLFSAASSVLGLGAHGAGKVMGLASYGRAVEVDIWPLMRLTHDGFDPTSRQAPPEPGSEVRWWISALYEAAGGPITVAGPQDLAGDAEAVRVAWSAQANLEAVMDFLAREARSLVGTENLCVAGGVALNCSANGRLGDPVYVPPVANDAGVALGAAWEVLRPLGAEPRASFGAYLGSGPGTEWRDVAAHDGGHRVSAVDLDTLTERVLEGAVVGVVEGRAEIGPRALGHRSIIALPKPDGVRDRVNRIKRRELWRPLSPVALRDVAGEFWSDHAYLTEYMLGAVDVTDECREHAPAIVHVDGTARPQHVDGASSTVGGMLSKMRAMGVPPVLMNTSLNGPREPIVNTGLEAIGALDRLGLDLIVIDGHVIERH